MELLESHLDTSSDEFKANEAAEIEFWSSWWNANASRFGDK